MMLRLELQRLTTEERTEEQMVEVCCADVEEAVKAGVLQINPMRGVLYVRAPGKYWAVKYCPFCGDRRK